MTVIGAGSYSIKIVNYNNDITVIKDNQDTDTNVSSSGINSKLDNAEAASDKSVDDVTSRKGMNSILRVRLGIMKILMLVKRLQI